MCCGGFGSPGGGGTGNIVGTLTADFYPVATGVNTIADGAIFDNSGSEIEVQQRSARIYKDGPGPNVLSLEAAGNGSYAQFLGKAAEGTVAAPTVLPDGATILLLEGASYDGAVYQDAGYLKLLRDGGGQAAKWELHSFDAAGVDTLGFVQNPDGTIDSMEAWTAQGDATVEGVFTANGTSDFNDVATLNARLVINTDTLNRFELLAIVAGNIAVDAELSDWFDLILSANATLTTPIGQAAGKKFMLRVRNNGGFTLGYGGGYRFSGGIAPVVSAGAGDTSYLYFVYNEISSVWDMLGEKLNFA